MGGSHAFSFKKFISEIQELYWTPPASATGSSHSGECSVGFSAASDDISIGACILNYIQLWFSKSVLGKILPDFYFF